jgi:rubredoxin
MEIPHKQVLTTNGVAIKLGQERIHIRAGNGPWHVLQETVQCPECETVYTLSGEFPKEQFLETVKEQHRTKREHPDYIAALPQFTHTGDCDCGQ